MKRLFLLLAVAMVAVSVSGCGTLRNWWHRGAACRGGCFTGQPAETVVEVENIPAQRGNQ